MSRKKKRVLTAAAVLMISAAVYVLGSLWVSANYLVVRKYEVRD